MKKLLLLFVLITACEDIIEVPDISENTVTVLAPTDQAVLNVTTVNFSWNALEDAEMYTLQVATPNFENAAQIVLDSTVASTGFTHALSPNMYQWRLRAENSDFQTTFTTQSFIINTSEAIDISNEEIVLLAPADDVFLPQGDVNFSWEPILGADTYIFQIATPNFDEAVEIVENTTTLQTAITISNLPSNIYQWRVKAVNADFETVYTIQNFTLEED